MTRNEAQAAFALANDNAQGFEHVDLSGFDGFGRPGFVPVHVTLRQVAGLMRWQALELDGGWDSEALNEVIELGRRRFLVLDGAAIQG